MHKTIRSFLLFIIMLLVSCSLDWEKVTKPTLPYWSTHLEIPLTTNIISIDEIMADIDDSSITKIPLFDDSSGDSILYAFQDKIEEEPDTITMDTGIEPSRSKIVSTLGPIELADIEPSDNSPSFSIAEIVPEASDNDGLEIPILDGVLNLDEKDFIFNDFKVATFKNGELIITIDNQLPITLEGITVNLKDDETVITTIPFSDPILPGTEGVEISLLDQKTLVDSMKVKVVGEYIGGGNIPIDLANDYFTVFISAKELTVSSAIAIIPPQSNPIDDKDGIPLSASENRLAWALFDKGFLNISIENSLDLDSEVKMYINEIRTDTAFTADSLYIEIPIPRPDIDEDIAIINTIVDLNGKYMVLYNGDNFEEFDDDSEQDISYSYNIFLDSTATDFREVSEYDEIKVSFDFFGDTSTIDSLIQFSRINGKIKEQKENIGPINQSPPSFPEEMDDFLLKDEYVEMALDLQMENYGIPIILNMEIKGVSSDSSFISVIENWDISEQGSYIKIPNAANLINFRPDTITITGSYVVGNNNDFTSLNVVESIIMKSNFIINIPFVFSVKSGSQINLDPEFTTPESFEGIEDIENMKLLVNYDNQFGFGADITVITASDTTHFADTSSVKPDTLVRSLFLENKTESIDSLELTKRQFDLFKDSIYVKTNVNIFGDEIFFVSTDSLILKLSASMNYLINAPDSTGTDND